MTAIPGPGGPQALPVVLVALMKGLIERDSDAALWQCLLNLETDVRDHVGALALELRIDEAEGFAYLAQRQVAEGEPELPRLVPRRPLSFHVSLLLALLRKKLAEHDAASGFALLWRMGQRKGHSLFHPVRHGPPDFSLLKIDNDFCCQSRACDRGKNQK